MRRFAPGWRMHALVLLGLPALLALGAWQLERGAQKLAMESAYLKKLTELPSAPTGEALRKPFQRVRLQGRFTDEIFLVDNQTHGGAAGYWIIEVFVTGEGSRLLTNRGFVGGMPDRRTLPQIDVPDGPVSVVGVVWPDTGLVPMWGEDVWTPGWPKRVQRLDRARMAAVADTLPVEIRLEAGPEFVVTAAPFAAVLGAARHHGYAATWFGLALALGALYLFSGFVREKPCNSALDAN